MEKKQNKKLFIFATAFNLIELNNRTDEITEISPHQGTYIISTMVHKCAPISELPSNINTMLTVGMSFSVNIRALVLSYFY